MNESLIHLTALLNGESVYYGGGMSDFSLAVLAKLVEAGEVVEHRSGSTRWWKIDPNTLAFVRERRKAA